jgi:hypothetical protein
MYGSSFWMVTVNPRACNNFARLALMMPLPNEEVTPPVTKMYLVDPVITLRSIPELGGVITVCKGKPLGNSGTSLWIKAKNLA